MVSSRVVTVAAVGVSSTLALYLFARHVSRPRCVSAALPKTMKQLRVVEPNRDCAKIQLEVVEVEMPTPGRNEVLVRMAAAPLNPSDLGFMRARARGATYPAVCGNEGSGTVVATGGGLPTLKLLGKPVGIIGGSWSGLGCYAEYVVAPAFFTVPLPADLPVADGCSFFVNPWTALQIASYARKHGGVLINTGGASALGKMLVKVAAAERLTLVSVVRSEEQRQVLLSLGAEHVLLSPTRIVLDPTTTTEHAEQVEFAEQLRATIHATRCTVAFDCVGGAMTGLLLTALPYGGTVYVYGRLSDEACNGIEPLDLIYRKKQVKGLFLGSFLGELGLGGMWRTAKKVAALLQSDMHTDFCDYTLTNWHQAVHAAGHTATTNAKPRLLLS